MLRHFCDWFTRTELIQMTLWADSRKRAGEVDSMDSCEVTRGGRKWYATFLVMRAVDGAEWGVT